MDHHRNTISSQQQDFANSLSMSPIQLYRGNSPPSPSQLSPLTRRSLLLSSVMAPLERSAATRNNYSLFPGLDNNNTEGTYFHSSSGSPNSNHLSLAMRTEDRMFGGGVPVSAPERTLARRQPIRRLPSAASSPEAMKRKRFLVFMKVLLKCLKKSSDLTLHSQAKAVIADCTQRNRYKDPRYSPLPEAVEQRLRPIVGEAQWNRANACLDLYLEKRREVHVQRARGMQQHHYAQIQRV